jgi:hypothetical protein
MSEESKKPPPPLVDVTWSEFLAATQDMFSQRHLEDSLKYILLGVQSCVRGTTVSCIFNVKSSLSIQMECIQKHLLDRPNLVRRILYSLLTLLRDRWCILDESLIGLSVDILTEFFSACEIIPLWQVYFGAFLSADIGGVLQRLLNEPEAPLLDESRVRLSNLCSKLVTSFHCAILFLHTYVWLHRLASALA